jgi:hypothetical protein
MDKRQYETTKWRVQNERFAPSTGHTIKDYDEKQFERSLDVAYEQDENISDRVIAYIAFPLDTTTLLKESDILWGAKVYSEPESWTDGDEYYRVYQVYVKEQYLHHITEELQHINGFYLRRH